MKAIQQRAASNKKNLANLSLSLTTTNDPTYPESRNHFLARTGSHESHRDLQQLDRIVRELQNILEDAKETRDDILASVSHFDSLLHPMRSLPDDILLLIFEWCTFSHKFKPRDYGSLGNEYPPWQLSNVCCRWRDLVLTSPRLWSVVHLPTFLFNGIPREGPIVSPLHLQLERSGNALLSVTIGNNVEVPTSDLLDNKEQVLSLLRASTKRWRSLHIYADDYGNDVAFSGCLFPALTFLEINNCSYYAVDAQDEEVVFTAFRHAPSLVYIVVYSTRLDIHWENVISYRTFSNSLAGHSLLPSLQQLTLDEPPSDNHEQPKQLTPLSLPNLHTLIVLFHRDVKLLDHLSMPSLETLHMTVSFLDSELDPSLPRYSERLRNLSLNVLRPPNNIEPLLSFVAGAPYVTALHLQDDLLLKTKVLGMNASGTPVVFPCLESLRVDLRVLLCDGNADVEVMDVIKSRLSVPVPKMRELRLIGKMSLVPQLAPSQLTAWDVALAGLRRLGIQVNYADTNEF